MDAQMTVYEKGDEITYRSSISHTTLPFVYKYNFMYFILK
jgi:hypothetical protein